MTSKFKQKNGQQAIDEFQGEAKQTLTFNGLPDRVGIADHERRQRRAQHQPLTPDRA
jgi:hypothetical protein